MNYIIKLRYQTLEKIKQTKKIQATKKSVFSWKNQPKIVQLSRELKDDTILYQVTRSLCKIDQNIAIPIHEHRQPKTHLPHFKSLNFTQ